METESDAADFRSLFDQTEKELVQKEKELVGICEQQLKHLKQQVFDRDKNIVDLNTKLSSLKEDFKYNLELLDGRDAELSQYELELSALQDSAKQASKNIQEAQQKLGESEFERRQEKCRAEEKDKLYQRTLLDMKQQMESLQLTREQFLGLQKQAFETACADLKSEVEKQQVDMERYSKKLEAQSFDKIRINELQSQIVLNGVKNKLSVAETTMKQMERESRAVEQEHLQTEAALRDIITQQDRIIKQISTEMKQLQSDMDQIKAIGDLNSRESEEKLQRLEVEHKQQMSQMKSGIRELQERFVSTESRLAACVEHPGQIVELLGKVGQLEKEMMAQEKEMNMRLHGVEAFIREAAQDQDQQVQDLKTQVSWWKAQHDFLLSKYTTQQDQLIGGSTNKEVTGNLTILQVPVVETIDRRKDAPTSSYNFELTSRNMSNDFLPQAQLGKIHSGTNNSHGSSLPSPSPLPSPIFSNIEETLHLGPVYEEIHTITQNDDLVNLNYKDDYNMQHSFKNDNEDAQLLNLKKENQGLRRSAQNLKDENDHLKSIIDIMQTKMGNLQKDTTKKAERVPLEKTSRLRSNNEDLSTKCDNEEIKRLQVEVHGLESEIQLLQLKKSKASLDQNQPQIQNQAIEAFQEENKKIDRTQCASNGNQQIASKIIELERVQRVLRMQLQSATFDLIRMANERDCLMEISNSLHADFNRFALQPNFEQSTLSSQNKGNLQYVYPAMNKAKSPEKEATPPLCPHKSPPKISRESTQMQDQPLETSPSRGSKQGTNIHTQSRNMQLKEDVDYQIGSHWLHLEGKMQSLKDRPEVTQDYVHKGTPSQWKKLEQASKRGEAKASTQMACRPRVRNYNIKDDSLAFQ